MDLTEEWLLRAADLALTHYSIGEARLVEVTNRIDGIGNIKFRVEPRNKQGRFLLSINYPIEDVPKRDVIESCLLWLAALCRDTDLVLPKPVPNRAGNLVTEILSVDEVEESVVCTLLHWIEGKKLSRATDFQRLPSVHVGRMGAIMAQLHQQARNWKLPTGFTRPIRFGSEDMQALLMGLYGRISRAEFAVLEEASQYIDGSIGALEKTDQTWGLIHGDLHPANCVLYGGEVRVIDFDSCGFGYYLSDMAQSLMLLTAPDLRRVFLKGYESLCKLSGSYRRTIEAFLIKSKVRSWSLRGEDRSHPVPQFITSVTRECRHYLVNEPFLFAG